MRILVLGGTQFLGRHIVDAALARGHDVTLFNRGQTRPELFPDVEKLRGDRDGDLAALARTRVRRGRRHERLRAAHRPRDDRRARRRRPLHVRLVDLRLRGSSPSRRPRRRRVAELTERDRGVPREAYGALKALCEDVVRERFPDAFVPRPGLIVGPWDPTGRFTYWPQRFADGGRVLAPAPPDADAQVIDARDLARLDRATRPRAASRAPTTRSTRRDAAQRAARDVPRASPAATPRSSGSTPSSSPSTRSASGWSCRCGCTSRQFAAMLALDPSAALAAGLEPRPLEETVRDTLAWVQRGEAPAEPPAGLDREKERQVLDAWLSKD